MSLLRRVTVLRASSVGGATLVLSLAVASAAQAAQAAQAAPGAHAAADGPQAAAAARRVAEPVRGLDISSYQHGRTPINWRLLARHGIRFVSVKVSEGTYYRNPFYRSDVRAAAAAGLAVMPYVFANPARAAGAPTARYAVRVTGRLRGPGWLPLVLDLENNPYRAGAHCYRLHGGKAAMIRWIAGFVGQARALTGKWPVIYTSASWWEECTGGTSRFRRDPLWLAAYGTRPAVPSTWGHWTFWQYSNAGRLPGIGPADLDYYQPTAALPALRPLPRRISRARVLSAKPSSRVRTRYLIRRQRRH
jgi:GH25 family lysozyme M1 (1,4-beta-N-acetylmuramidase)